MKIFFITKSQKILVDPIGYVNNDVTCEIPDTDVDICFSVPIEQLRTEDDKLVTRKILSKLFE
jgi:hypothetical protein